MKSKRNKSDILYLYQAIFYSENILVLALDRDGKVLFVNNKGANILGYQPREMIGKDWFENFLPEPVRREIFEVFKKILKGNKRHHKVYQNEIVCKNGDTKTIFFTNSLIKEKRKITGTLSIGIDITEFAGASRKLKNLQYTNEILIDTSFKLNRLENIEKISELVVRAAKRLTGSRYGYAGYIDEKTGNFYIPRFSREIMSECRLKDKQVVFKEFRGLWGWSLKNKKVVLSNNVAKDRRSGGIPRGHIQIERFLALPVIDNNKVVGQIAVANSDRDYTKDDVYTLTRLVNLYNLALKRVHYQDSLNDVLKKYYISVEVSNQILYSYNLDTGKVIFEGNLEKIMGYKSEELPDSAEGIFRLVHPEDRERFINISSQAKDYIETTVRVRKKDGNYIYIQLRGLTIRDKKSGERIRYGMVSDISDTVKYENEILRREEEIRQIFENMPLPVAIMDRFKDVIYLNKVFTSIYGYQKEDINPFDKWVSEAFPFAKAEEIDYYVRLIFEDETDIDEKDSLIIKIRGKSGEHFYSKFYKKVIGNKIVLILENITEEIKRKKKTELINTLLRINTEINREIAKIEDSVAIIRKTIELFLRSKILKSICAFTFTGANYRKLVMIDEKEEIKYFDDSMTPDCVLESVKADGKIIIRKTADNCVNCKIKNKKNDEIAIIVPFQNNRIFYGNLIIFPANEMFTDDDILSILGGIAKDIALRIDNLALQKQNRDYIERIKSIARFPAENPNPLVRIDRNGILLYANPASQEIISFWKSSIGSSIPDNIKNYVDIAFETSNKYETEFYLNDRIYYVYIVPFHDSGYANLYFIDITEKKKQELALRESEDRLRRILDVAPFGIYIVNSDYDITYLNPFVEKSLGKVNGRKCYEYFNDFDSPCDFCQMEKVKNGETIKRTFEAPKTNRIYELIDIPYKNPDGSISKLQIFNDITEIKNAERMIRESEEKFRKLFNEAPVGYYLQGENGVFIDGNAVAERLTGYKKEELIGKNFLETGLIPEDKINEAFDFFRRSILEGNSGPFEMEIIRKDGNRTTLEIFVRYIELGGKKVILGIASDISDRIRMQNEIIKANRELERLSDGLKQEVEKQTEKIRKSEKMAIIIKNVILTVSNLISEEEILKESAYYLSEQLGFKAFGYYISEKGDYNINFFVNHGLCNVETDFQSFNENVLKYLARNYYNTLKPRRILKEDLNFFPEFAEKFEQNCQEIVLIPVIYKDISLGFMLFFLAKGTDNDAIMMDAFEQLSLQIGTIIEQKRADAKRERLSKLYESVLNSAGDGIVGTDNNLNIIFANKSALNILGYIEREIIGENIHRILHSGTDTELHRIEECPIRNSLQLASEIKSEDEIFFKSNGDKINVKTIITPIVENGESTGVVVAFSDITDEKKRRDEINRLATALNQYPVAIGFIDKAGNIRYVNEAFERHTGYSKAELSHMNIDDLNKGITLLIKKNPYENIYRQYNFLKKDGSRIFEMVTIAPIIDSSNNINDYIVIKDDITQHIEIQEAHKEAKEEAERANRAKTAFLATISHEMRTPLTGVKGFVNELASTDLIEKQREILQKAQTATEHLVSIVNDVLDYSKIESGRMDIENIGFDLITSIEKVRSITAIKAEEKGLDLRFEIDEGIPRYVKGDPQRLEQILINLISNAAKFTYKGGISVRVSKKAEIGKKVVLLFSVKDTGIGIKDEDKVKIFTPFSQADSSVSRKFGGTGLGLAISKYFVEKMGGDIWVDSTLGKGSVFYFTAEFEITTEDKIEIEEKFVPPPMMLKGSRVLLAEDNEFNQELISNLLKKYGAVVEYAENGREAVDMVFSKPPDYYNFILMDIQMPIMDGKTATKIILENELYKNLPIIAMTAHAFKDDVAEMLNTGMVAHIPKPFDEANAMKVMSKYYFNKTAQYEFSEESKKTNIPDFLQNLSSVDVADGLNRVSYNIEVYTKMLKGFAEKYRKAGEEISLLIEKNEFKEAETIVHTIKGVSGNLGIKGLYEKSVYLDNLLKSEEASVRTEEALRSFLYEMKIVLEELDGIPALKERSIETADDNLFDEKLKELRKSLEGGDTEALDIFLSIEGNLIGRIGKDNVDKIKSMIENFSHREALDLINSIQINVNQEDI